MKIIILGTPTAKKRPRFSRFAKNANYMYDPQACKKRVVRDMKHTTSTDINRALEAKNTLKAEYFDVVLRFYLPIVKSWSEAQKNARLWDWEPASTTPDLDNLEKFILDCGNGILWEDDCRITSLSSIKRYSENPRTEIFISGKRKNKYPEMVEKFMKISSPGKLSDIAKDAKALTEFDLEKYMDMNEQEREELLVSSVSAVLLFFENHADMFRKICKIKKAEVIDFRTKIKEVE